MDRVAAPVTDTSAAFRLFETFGAETDIVVDGCELNGAEFRDARNDEFGRRLFVSLIVTNSASVRQFFNYSGFFLSLNHCLYPYTTSTNHTNHEAGLGHKAPINFIGQKMM